ncbi:MAG: MFS transporter [Candidatus Bathyarchaeia archaeon]
MSNYSLLKPKSWFETFIPINAALGGIQPILPLYVVAIGGSLADVGIVLFAYNLVAVFSSIIWGKLSDSLGIRKKIILIGLSFSSLTFCLIAYCSKVYQLIILNAILGFFLTAYIPVVSMLIIELYPRREWEERISLYNMFCGIGWMLGSLIGAVWLVFLNLRSFFIACAILSLTSLIIALKKVKDPYFIIERHYGPLIPNKISEMIAFIPHLIFHIPKLLEFKRLKKLMIYSMTRSLPLFYLSSFIFLTAFNLFFIPLPVYLKFLNLSNTQILILYLINSVASTLCYLKSSILLEKFKGKKLVSIAVSLRIIIFILILVLGIFKVISLSFAIPIFALFMAILGLTWPLFWVPTSTMLINLADRDKLGIAQGGLNSIVGTSSVLASILSGYLTQYIGFQFNFFISAFLTVLGLLILSLLQA